MLMEEVKWDTDLERMLDYVCSLSVKITNEMKEILSKQYIARIVKS